MLPVPGEVPNLVVFPWLPRAVGCVMETPVRSKKTTLSSTGIPRVTKSKRPAAALTCEPWAGALCGGLELAQPFCGIKLCSHSGKWKEHGLVFCQLHTGSVVSSGDQKKPY